jgi:hypothetical protein
VAAGGEELTLEVLWQEWLLVLAAPQLW